MSPTIALLCQITIPLLAGLAVTFYLRNVTRKLLIDLCGTDDRASFWLRTTNILMLGAPLAMVLFFGDTNFGALPTDSALFTKLLRQTVNLSLIGILLAVALFSRGIWKQIPALNDHGANGEA